MPASPASASNDAPPGPGSARVLVVVPSWLGDCVMCLPALAALRRRLHGGHLAVLAKPAVAALWSVVAGVDEVIVLRKGAAGLWRTVRQVRAGGYDFAYVLPKSFRSAWVPFMAVIPGRCGMQGHGRDWMLTETVRLSEEARHGHQSLEMAEVFRLPAESLGAPPFFAVPVVQATQARQVVTRICREMGLDDFPPLVAIFPGAAHGASKRWPAERFAEVGRRLVTERHCGVLVLGARADRPLGEEVARVIGARAVCLAGATDLPELVAVLGLCRVAIANDSGGLHLAVAAGTGGVGIFGLTDPRKTGPVGSRCRLLTPPGVSGRRDIPRTSMAAHKAFRSITVDDVHAAAVALL